MDNREELVQKVNLFLYVQSEIREEERVSDIWLVREQRLEIGEGRKLGRGAVNSNTISSFMTFCALLYN